MTKSIENLKDHNSKQNSQKGIKSEIKEKIIRKSYALTKQDIEHIEQIKDKCLNRRVVLNDSHIVRIALMLTSKLTESAIIKASTEVPKLTAGRPRGRKNDFDL